MEEELEKLKQENQALRQRMKETDDVISAHITKLPIDPLIQKRISELSPAEKLGQIVKHGGGYRPSTQDEKRKHALSARKY